MTTDAAHALNQAVVICDEAVVPPAFRERGWPQLPIRSHGHGGDLNLRADNLRTHYLGRLHRRANNLVRIAAFAFAADQQLSRGGKGDPSRRQWRREIALCVPVADVAFWSDEDTTTALAEALDFGTEDHWEFAFSPSTPEDRELQLGMPLDTRQILAEPDCVAMLSGGIDSLCAVVEAIGAHHRRPVLVSHRSTPPGASVQERLLAGLEARFPAWAFPHLSFWIHQRGAEAVARTRRTRGFLVAALGAAVAGQADIPTVLLPDNGYVSINPPINAQLVGALNSRGTHPMFLRLVNRLLDLVFPGSVQIENPLAQRTRAEALGLLREHGCEGLVTDTQSCAHSRRPAGKAHCGVCSQCVDRRFATIAARMESLDPVDGYEVDLFTAPLPPGDPRVFATSYVQHAIQVDQLSPEDLYLAFPELEACLDLDAQQIGDPSEVLKRHADEVLQVMGEQIRRHGDDLVRAKLPPTCLVHLAIGAGTRGGSDEPVVDPVGNDAASQESPSTKASERPRFEKEGKGWFVTFGDERGYFPQAVGMDRLARLLKAPGQELRALDLVVGSSPRRPATSSPNTGADLDGMRASGDLGPILDAAARDSLLQRARQLGEELVNAEGAGDEHRLFAIRDELEQIESALKEAKGYRGRSREVPNDGEKARQTVWHAIEKALKVMAPHMPGMHEHLRASLRISHACTYDPRPPLVWDVTL